MRKLSTNPASLFASVILPMLTERSMNQADLSRSSGVSQADLSRFINGRRVPNSHAVTSIAAALLVPASTLAEKIGASSPISGETFRELELRSIETHRRMQVAEGNARMATATVRALEVVVANLHQLIAAANAERDIAYAKLTARQETSTCAE